MDINNIKWIKPIIMEKWSSLLSNGGADIDGKDGKIEEFKDFDQNGEVGNDQDFWFFMEKYKTQIVGQIDFIAAGQQLQADNPLHNYLLGTDTAHRTKLFSTITQLLGQIGSSVSISSIHASVYENKSLDTLSANDKEQLFISLGHEYNTAPAALFSKLSSKYYSQGVEFFNAAIVQKDSSAATKNYQLSLQSASEGLILLDKAQHYAQQAAAIDPVLLARFYHLQAQALAGLENHTEAITSYEKAAALYSDNKLAANALLQCAASWDMLNNKVMALTLIDRALELNDDKSFLATVNFKKALLLEDLGKNTEAIEKYTLALSLSTNPREKGQINYQLGSIAYNEAVDAYNEGNTWFKTSEFKNSLAQYQLAEKKFTSANLYFNEAWKTTDDAALKKAYTDALQIVKSGLEATVFNRILAENNLPKP